MQSTLIAIIPKATASISILASAYGIRVILSTPHDQVARCNRLIMAMLGHDIMRCFTFVAGTWLIPTGTADVFQAVGNDFTCATQAFISQLGYAVPLYSSSISCYYYVEIKNDFKKRNIQWAEKWCHFFPNIISLFLSCVLIGSGQYGVDGKRRRTYRISFWVHSFRVLFYFLPTFI